MDRPKDSQKSAKGTLPEAKKQDEEIEYNLITLYLTLYNWISAVLWAAILGRIILTLAAKEYTDIYDTVGWLAKWTQTLAALEMMHSAMRIVRAPLATTIMQVSSRFFLVWIIVDKFPHLAKTSPAYTTMLLAWSITEVIRYSYFTAITAFASAPGLLKWLRYNSFVLLYPLGISSEVWMVILAREPAAQLNPMFENVLYAVLAFYAPGSWILFTHMLAQRKKVMRGPNQTKRAK